MQMYAFADPYLNVKLYPCLCQQLNYTLKNEARLRKHVVSFFRTDNNCKSALHYHVSHKEEELVLCKHSYQVPQHQAHSGG